MRILIAPDSFKGTLTAHEAANAILAGLSRSIPDADFTLMPMADGGEGSAEVWGNALGGVQIPAQVHDPLMRPIKATYRWIESDKIAIIDVAQASGITHLATHELNPLQTSSFGTGELLLHALDQGMEKLWICLGGSATVDGGLSLVTALGGAGGDAQGREISPDGQGMIDLEKLDLSNLDARLNHVNITALCDVDNVLTGEYGARMFMPQKGADATMMDELDVALFRWGELLQQQSGANVADLPGAGAAGGLGAGLAGVLGAKLVPGVEFIMDRIGIDSALKQADWVVTGEGRFDVQTARGKVVAGVANRASEYSVPVIVVCGTQSEALSSQGLSIEKIFSIVPDIASEADALHDAAHWLEAVAFHAGVFIQSR